MKKQPKSDKAQRIAASILTAFMFCETMDQFHETWQNIYNEYGLCDDPFTHCPCSSKECEENETEYRRQKMIERYGYYED